MNNNTEEIFGEVIRKQAIADGVLVDVTSTARETTQNRWLRSCFLKKVDLDRIV